MMQAMQDTHAVFLNGFLFDELPADMVLSALLRAKSNGTVVCFDPGPRWGCAMTAARHLFVAYHISVHSACHI